MNRLQKNCEINAVINACYENSVKPSNVNYRINENGLNSAIIAMTEKIHSRKCNRGVLRQFLYNCQRVE